MRNSIRLLKAAVPAKRATLLPSAQSFVAAVSAKRSDLLASALIFGYGMAYHRVVMAQNIIVGPLCKGYNNIFDNQFIGLTAMASFTMILLKMKFSDKTAEAMGGLTKTGIGLSALLSLPEIMGWFNVQPCH